MIRFSDLFRSNEDESDAGSANLSLDAGAGTDGADAAAETSRDDGAGNQSFERTGVEAGDTEAGAGTGSTSEPAQAQSQQEQQLAADNGPSSDDTAEPEARIDAGLDAGTDGIRVETESYSRDANGETAYDRTSIDTGDTDVALDINLDDMADGMNGLSTASDDSALFE